jgi:hypothetical protein
MIRIHSQTQLTLEGFETPFERSMDKNNHWIKLSACIPWDDLANTCYQSFNASAGRPAKDAQLVIGAVSNIDSSSAMKKPSHKSRKIHIYNTFAA